MIRFWLMVSLVVFVSCSHTIPSQEQFTLWRNHIGRIPASVGNNHLFKSIQDFVLLDDYGKQIYYRMETSFWTSKDKEYLQQKLKLVVEKTMHDVLTDLANDKQHLKKKGAVMALFKKRATEYILQEFVKTLYFYKIVNGNFEFNISVIPYKDDPNSFSHEFASNQLIIIPLEGNLSTFLTQKNYGLPEKIDQVQFPSQNDLTFLGGNIALRIKLLDFDFNPLKPIPRPKQNAVKGEIVIRRYFFKQLPKVNFGTDDFLLQLDNKNCDVSYLTVDDIYHFNLKNIKPKFFKTTVFLGKLKARDHLKTGLFSHFSYVRFKHEKSVKKGSWSFNGKYLDMNRHENFYINFHKFTQVANHKVKIDAQFGTASNIMGEDVAENIPWQVKKEINLILDYFNIHQFFSTNGQREIK